MKNKLIALVVISILLLTTVSTAADFVVLGECPALNAESNPSAITLDPYENEIYGNAVEITQDEYYNTIPFMSSDSSFIPFSGSVWNSSPSAYNDGLKMELITGEHPDYGQGESWTALTDMNGKSIISTLPGGWQRTWDYSLHYNFGYITEGVEETYMEDYHDIFAPDYDFAYSTITNAFTGQVYILNNINIISIDNDGIIRFSVPLMRNGVFDVKYYRATLKKSAVVSVFLNCKKIASDQTPVIENGRTLVPLRAIFEALGASVSWNGETNTVNAVKGATTVSLTVDNPVATVNGQALNMDVPAKIISGRTMVPVRFIADCFGVSVSWDAAMQKVSLFD